MAFVAVVGDGLAQRMIGVARYATAPGSSGCEFAIAVADEWQSRGVGTRSRVARRLRAGQGIHTSRRADIAHDSQMRGLANRLGFRFGADPDEFSMLDARLDLSPPQATS